MSEAITIVVVCVGAYFLIDYFVKSSGRTLARKFVSLGDLRGMTESEIVDEVGPPTSRAALPNGKRLLQWIVTGYHIGLIFDGKRCEGVSNEFADLS